MDLSLLRTVLAVYRTGSLTKAARALGISQPAVTGHLRTLESRLGQPLFLRLPDGTVPTDAAHDLVRETADALDSLEEALWRRLKPEKLADRSVRLAGPAEIVTSRVLPALADLIGEGLRLQISLGLTDDLVRGLAEGMYDLVVTTTRPKQQAITAVPLMDEEFVLVAAGVWADRLSAVDIGERGPRALEGVPIVSYASSLPIIRRYWMTVFGERPTGTAQIIVPDLRAVLAAVKAGAGISVLPTYLCSDEVHSGEVRVLLDVEVPPLNTLFLARRAGASMSVGVRTVHSHLLMKAPLWH